MAHYNYVVVVVLLMIGLYVVMANHNLVKKVIGLSIFQTGVFVLYISLGAVEGGHAPILDENIDNYANPLPHVLILTAIVVGVATTALALALVVRIYRAYGSFEERELVAADSQAHADTFIDIELEDILHELGADEPQMNERQAHETQGKRS
ncbi:MAG: cation:proton antiporter subunit C [Gammaproteobacteria bacterium]